jgi:PAS domain S-box-containing protein
MKNETKKSSDAEILRLKAEDILKEKHRKESVSLPETEIIKLWHELEVYQVELEMQNEELQLALKKTETAVSLYDFAPTGYLTVGSDGTILELNFASARMLAKERSALINNNFKLFVTPPTRKTYDNFIQKVLTTNIKQSCEVQLLIKDNYDIFVLLEGIVSENESKGFISVVDISEIKQLEINLILAKERAERNEKDLNKVQKLTQIGSWHLDLATNEVSWTKELYKMYGLDPALPAPPHNEQHKIYTPESWEALSLEVEKIRETGIPYELELKTVRANGSNGWIWARGETVVDKDNKTIGLWGSAQDITERRLTTEELLSAKQKAADSDQLKAAKEQAEEGENYLNNIISNIGDPIFVKDNQSRILIVNDAFCEIFGLKKADILGKTLAEDVSPAERRRFLKIDKQVLSTGIESINEESLTIRDGQTRTISTRKTRFVNSDGNKFLVGVIHDITELKAAIEHAEDYTERFRLLTLNMEAGVVIHAPDTSIVQVNSRASEILGSSDDQLKGKTAIDPDWKFVNLDKSPLPLSDYPVNRIASSKAAIKNQLTGIYQPNKEDIVWLTVNGFPVLNNTGDITEIVTILIDITEQKQHKEDKLEAKLKFEKTKNELNEAQKLAHIGSWLFNLKTEKIEWSDETFNIWGFDSKKDAAPDFDTLVERIHTDDLELFNSSVGKAMDAGTPYDIEHRICLPNGRQKVVRAICQPVMGINGEVVSLAGTSQDITVQKRTEKSKDDAVLRLEKTQKELNEAQKLAQVGSWLFNPSNQKSEWSGEMFHIWGFDSERGTPEFDPILKRIHPSDLDFFNEALARAISPGTPFDIELRLCIPDAEQKVIRSICEPALGDAGEVIGLTGSTQDITAQKLFEEVQVKHQRLKAIGEMSSSIAHDFNNSLQEMMGNLEVVKLQTDLSDNTIERINNIGSIIGDVAGRVSSLQKFGDPENDDKNAKPIDFNQLIEESLEQSRPLWKDSMEKEGLRISVKTDFAEIPKINCNSGELKSAVHNLIKNSIEAMPEGGDLMIQTSTNGERVFASFTDTGIGMSEETKLKIFEPFFSTKGFKLGRGLGMSGAYTIVKKYSGEIRVKSSEWNKGTTIEIVFPASHQEEIKVLNKDEPKEQASLNVLWVDDDLIIAKSAQIMVESIGHKCKCVNSAEKALEYLNKNTCDIVFTDIGMPKMNGWELAEAIRNKFGNRITIVAVTGWNIEKKVEEEKSTNYFLKKPFALYELKLILLNR